MGTRVQWEDPDHNNNNNDKALTNTNARLRRPEYAQALSMEAVTSLQQWLTMTPSSTQCHSDKNTTCNNVEPPNYRVVLGLGPGRCGTQSLTHLLNAQEHVVHAAHEMIVPRVWARDTTGRMIYNDNDNNDSSGRGSWGADRRLEWEASRLVRGARPRTAQEQARWRVLRLWEQTRVFQSWIAAASVAENTKQQTQCRNNNNNHIPVVAAVSSAGLAHVHEWIALDPFVKIVVLMRPRDQVVQSFLKKSKGRNHWQQHGRRGGRTLGGDSPPEIVQRDKTWDDAFPNMSDHECQPFLLETTTAVPDKACALRAYWQLYHDVTHELSQRYPNNVRIWDMHAALNDASEQEALLKWCGFDHPRLQTNERWNQQKTR